MRILITGASGFIGNAVCKALDSTDHELILLVRNSDNLPDLSGKVTVIHTSQENWKTLVSGAQPQVILHFAAFLTSSSDSSLINELIETNILFATHVLDAISGTGVQYFINTGTFAEYAQDDETLSPSYLYAASKTAFRSILQFYSEQQEFKVINIIPYTVYGGISKQKKLIDYLYEAVGSSETIKMSPGEQVLDFIHIDDVSAFYRSLLKQLSVIKDKNTEIHLGTGKGSTPREICSHLESAIGKTANVQWGGISYRKNDTMYAVAQKKMPQELIEWQPRIDLKEGLKKYIETREEKK